MKNNISDFKSSHITYFNEKYYSILAELKNLYLIIHYYKEKKSSSDTNPTINTFEVLEKDIKELISHIKKIRENNKYGLDVLEYAENSLKFLIYLDVHKHKMENILEHFSALHQKCIQIIYETSPQILPHPLLQKRYASKVLSEFLEDHTQTLYHMLTDKKKKKILSYWTHKEDYRVTKGITDDLLDFNGQSFYYHDLIYSIPTIIDHEIILLAIQGNEKVKDSVKTLHEKIKTSMENFQIALANTLKEEFNKIIEEPSLDEEKLEAYIARKDNAKRIDNFMEQFDDVLWELFADYIGFLMYGDAYKLAFIHETLSKSLGRDFWDEKINTKRESIDMGLRKQRDGLLLRQLLVLNFTRVPSATYPCSKLLNSDFAGNYFNVAKGVLESFLNISQKDTWFEKTENTFSIAANRGDVDSTKAKNYMHSLNEYNLFMTSFYTVLNSEIIETNILYENLTFISSKFGMEKFFYNDAFSSRFTGHPEDYSFALKIWEERFGALKYNKVPHRSLLRNFILNPSDNHPAYVMEFKRSLLGTMNHDEGVSLGLFDEISIRPAIDNQVNQENHSINIVQRIEDLMDIDKLDVLETAFVKKHSLLKVFEEGNPNRGDCTLYLQLFLKESRNVEKINEIIKTLKVDKEIQKTVAQHTLYKSLGPEDLVYELQGVEQNSIWEIVEHILIAYKDYFVDSYTIIKLNEMQLGKNIWIKSKCKLKSVLKYDDFVSKIKESNRDNIDKIKNEALQIFDMTGNHDFELWWNVDSFEEILTTYNYLKNNDIILEMQFYLMNDISNRSDT